MNRHPWRTAAWRMIEDCVRAGSCTKEEHMRIRYAWIAAIGIGRLLDGEKRPEVTHILKNNNIGKYAGEFLKELKDSALIKGRL